MARLIALYSSTPQSGKTTIANHLAEAHGYSRVKFAGPMKSMLYAMLRAINNDPAWCVECLDGSLKEKKMPILGGQSPRDLMISLGTTWGRDMVNKDIWAHIGKLQALALLAHGEDVVIDDMRLPNEYAGILQLIHQAGGDKVDLIRVVKTTMGVPVPVDGKTEGLLDAMPWTATWVAPAGKPGQLLDMADAYLGLLKTPEKSVG